MININYYRAYLYIYIYKSNHKIYFFLALIKKKNSI